MSDTTAAHLMDEVIGERGIREPVKSMLERAFRSLSKVNPKWTRRRVRAIWDNEASRIEYREIVEMQAVITARKQHADFRAETARLAAMHINQSADRLGALAQDESCRSGGMDRP